MEEVKLDKQSVQWTMLLPLWGRATASYSDPEILNDPEAERIVRECGYDFKDVERSFGEYAGVCYVVRARKTDDAIKDFIKKHPKASIVNIGSGLDTMFSRVDNGQIKWYNLDLPDAIAFRESLITEKERSKNIPISMLDTEWFERVDFNKEDGAFFFAAGVFHYFKEEELKVMVSAMAEHFPKGELFFDAETAAAIKKSNKMVRKTGNTNAVMYFSVNKAKKLNDWSPKVRLISEEPYFKGIKRNKKWKLSTRIIISMSDAANMVKFIHLRFE